MKYFKYFVLFLFLGTTISVVLIKPTVLKPVKIENTNFLVDTQMLDTSIKEEKVDWNKWHLDLSKKIMKEARHPRKAPLGITNYIQFNVDNKRNIFNIKISTSPAQYTKIAKLHFFDYINNLNGNKILEFPKYSKRKVVLFKLDYESGTTIKYPKLKDFSDIEVVDN